MCRRFDKNDGIADGAAEGLRVGTLLGVDVGLLVGTFVGTTVGALVASFVGTTECKHQTLVNINVANYTVLYPSRTCCWRSRRRWRMNAAMLALLHNVW